jgi:hypothetical protein
MTCRQIFIDSRDRISGTPQSFNVQLRDTLTTSNAHWRIDDVRIPLVIPRVQTGRNDIVYMSSGLAGGPTLASQVRTVTLVQGTYSGTDLAKMIHDCFYAQHPENPAQPESTDTFWAVSYSNTTAGMSIASLVDPNFRLLTDADLIKVGVSPVRSFCSQLFLDAGSAGPKVVSGAAAGGGAIWSFPFVSMVPCDLVYLASTTLSTQDNFGPNGASDTIYALPTSTDFASVLTGSMNQAVWMPCPNVSTQQLDFRVLDRNYNLLTSLPNWSATLTIRQ